MVRVWTRETGSVKTCIGRGRGRKGWGSRPGAECGKMVGARAGKTCGRDRGIGLIQYIGDYI